jgi:tetratricopeptide (TPR) repeat protein
MFMGNLQDVLRFQGKLDEAKAMAIATYQGTCLEWGKNHLRASQTRSQLKEILWDLGEFAEAEYYARLNLDVMKGSPYSTEISSINDIALLLDTLSGQQVQDSVDRSDEILSLVKEVLTRVNALSEESLNLPSTLQDLIYLAMSLEVLRIVTPESTKLESKIYYASKVVFGISDRNTINSLTRLSKGLRWEAEQKRANNENGQSDLDKATKLCLEAMEELKVKLLEYREDDTKQRYLATLSWLAVLYKHLGEHDKARIVYDEAYAHVMAEGYIARSEYETLYSIQGLAEDLEDQRRYEASEELHLAVLNVRRERYGDHPCIDDSLYALSCNLRRQNRLEQAASYAQEAYDIAKRFRGDHRNTYCIQKRLASLLQLLSRFEDAEKHYREVLSGFRKLGTRHRTRITETLEDLQELLCAEHKWAEARPLILEALERRSIGWDANRSSYAGLLRHLAIVAWHMGDLDESLQRYCEARKVFEEVWRLPEERDLARREQMVRTLNVFLPGTEHVGAKIRLEDVEGGEDGVAEVIPEELGPADYVPGVVHDEPEGRGDETPKAGERSGAATPTRQTEAEKGGPDDMGRLSRESTLVFESDNNDDNAETDDRMARVARQLAQVQQSTETEMAVEKARVRLEQEAFLA